jgi:hypothetical protein
LVGTAISCEDWLSTRSARLVRPIGGTFTSSGFTERLRMRSLATTLPLTVRVAVRLKRSVGSSPYCAATSSEMPKLSAETLMPLPQSPGAAARRVMPPITRLAIPEVASPEANTRTMSAWLPPFE